MAHSFCTNCGNKMTYTYSPPNFCGKCGNPLTAQATASKPKTPTKRARQVDDNEEDEEEDTDGEFSSASIEVPQLDSIDCSIEDDGTYRQPFQLGELFGQPKQTVRRDSSLAERLAERKTKNGK